MKVTPSASSISWMTAMYGWWIIAAARASWMKRSFRSGSATRSGGKTRMDYTIVGGKVLHERK